MSKEQITETFTCKCCGMQARWCDEGPKACGAGGCFHIHCDHCGMHYSLESPELREASTDEEMKNTMRAAYLKLIDIDDLVAEFESASPENAQAMAEAREWVQDTLSKDSTPMQEFTMRDHFAAMAMAAYLPMAVENMVLEKDMAESAYCVADAMLEARKQS